MKKWLKLKKSYSNNDSQNLVDSRRSFVRNQLDKLIGELEREEGEEDERTVWRTQYHKRSKTNFYQKFSYV